MSVESMKLFKVVCDDCKDLRRRAPKTVAGPIREEDLIESKLRLFLEREGWVIERIEYDDPLRFTCPYCVQIKQGRASVGGGDG